MILGLHDKIYTIGTPYACDVRHKIDFFLKKIFNKKAAKTV
jgi:hypothetical protein